MMRKNDKKTVTVKEARSTLGRGELILAVEDEEMLRDFLQTVLEECGYRVILAVDGTEALRKYAEHMDEIDLVIMDMGLPRISGEVVLSKLVALNPNVKVIAVSGTAETEVQRSVLQNGAMDFSENRSLIDHLHSGRNNTSQNYQARLPLKKERIEFMRSARIG